MVGEGDRVAAAAEKDDEVTTTLKPDEPELPDTTFVEFDCGGSELSLVGDGPVDIVLDARGPDSDAGEVAREPLESHYEKAEI